MSGICGVYCADSPTAELPLLRLAAAAGSYRGPDGIAYWVRSGIGLANLALHSTPEVENDTQPAISDDRRLCVTADARIDHRHRLAAELREAGTLRAAHPTDAQLILAAYERWVEECPAHLEGDFAFALWDGRQQRLFCARDSRGVRSLHFARLGDALWVASDAAQILAVAELPRSIDPWWIADYLTDIVLEPRRSPFRGLEELPPGHHLIASRNGLQLAPTPAPAGDLEPHPDSLEAACRVALRSPAGVVGLAVDASPAAALLASTVARISAENASTPELLALGHPAIEGPAEAPFIDSPYSGWTATERELLQRLADRGGRVLLTTQGATCFDPASVRVDVPRWLGREWVRATDLETRLRTAAAGAGPKRRNSYPRAPATDSIVQAMGWQARVAADFGIEVRHPLLDLRCSGVPLSSADAASSRASVPAAILADGWRSLDGELRIVDQGFCSASGLDRALADAGGASDAERELLWRTLTLERWLREHDLVVDW